MFTQPNIALQYWNILDIEVHQKIVPSFMSSTKAADVITNLFKHLTTSSISLNKGWFVTALGITIPSFK